MEDVCSLHECGLQIVGQVVVVASMEDEEQSPLLFDTNTLQVFQSEERYWVLLHPNCFVKLFNEAARVEAMVAIRVILGPIGEIRAAMEEDDGEREEPEAEA